MKLNEVGSGFGCVYKINYPNGKSYIGATIDLKRRFWEHNNLNVNRALNDRAMLEFGKVSEVEILHQSDNKDELEAVEAYWISFFNTTHPDYGYNVSVIGSAYGRRGDDNPLSKVSDAEVRDIRDRKKAGESRKSVYADYSCKLALKGGFDRIWNGESRTNISTEIISHFNNIEKDEKISRANRGSLNGRACVSEEDVKKFRCLYDKGDLTIKDIHDDNPHISYSTLRRICKRKTWKHVE